MGGIHMTALEDKKRLDAIIDGASKLSVKNQEFILKVIKEILLARNLATKHSPKASP